MTIVGKVENCLDFRLKYWTSVYNYPVHSG